MAQQSVFKKDDAGIRALLKSDGCMEVMKSYAKERSSDGDIKPFIGFDRAKVFVKEK